MWEIWDALKILNLQSILGVVEGPICQKRSIGYGNEKASNRICRQFQSAA